MTMTKTLRLSGIGLRPQHMEEFILDQPKVAWVEVHSENYFDHHDLRSNLLKIRQDYPVSLHGVCMSLGSIDELDYTHAQKLKDLIQDVNPCLISEHLSWSRFKQEFFHDLLPMPFTHEALEHFSNRVNEVQDFLGRQILIENVSSYVRFNESTFTEAEFLNALSKRTGCGVLLDINNIYVSCHNFGEDPNEYMNALSTAHVQEFHLGGHQPATHPNFFIAFSNKYQTSSLTSVL